MQHWTIHLILRVIIICITFFILLAVFSGDGSSDAMGNALESAFAMVISFTISLISAMIFLVREYVQLSRKNENAKAACNIVTIIAMLLIPVMAIVMG